jgi:hypothetical protein
VPTTIAGPGLRPLFTILAAWLIALQAFLAGVAIARAGAMAADPLAVICHSAVGGSQDFGSQDVGSPDFGSQAGGSQDAPGDATLRHLCCTACLTAAPALLVPETPAVEHADEPRAARQATLAQFTVILPRGAVRAGPSQAPPSLA